MSTITHDESGIVTEHASYRWGFLVLAFGLLAAVAYRSFALGESPWDMLVLVILSGAVTTAYQVVHSTRPGRRLVAGAIAAMVAGVIVAFILGVVR